jgi:hypothetical protein
VYLLYIYEYDALKSVEVMLRRRGRKMENNREDEPNMYTYMEMSQQNPLHYYCIVIRMLKRKY